MLEPLTLRIQDKIPPALNAPIPESHAYHYWSRRMEGLTTLPDFLEVQNEYQTASVTFSYQEISQLSDKQFLSLQQQLQNTVGLFFTQQGMDIPSQISSHLIPGDKKNVLIHEKKHLDALPEKAKETATIDISIEKSADGQLSLNGTGFFDPESATNKEKALSFSAPQSLSETDIATARQYAQQTQNPEFIELIEQKIQQKERH